MQLYFFIKIPKPNTKQIYNICWKPGVKLGKFVSKKRIPNCVTCRFKCQFKKLVLSWQTQSRWKCTRKRNSKNTSLSCIDLISTSTPNLITHSGVHSSLHLNCHHLNCQLLRNSTNILYIHHLIFERSSTTKMQIRSLLEVPSKNSIGKEHFLTQALTKIWCFEQNYS